ncbi:DNL zinc finger-domain-containing protein [Lophiotrema nucula]|uniref:DNL zinc finger-domain-containing protein n=1 Tax=Lophiotrema nucula TaxID=690887 RepID=A0A6A5YLZ3_9PLEO|nr:DNL zinc finger-domain-containing protein [Lophiotrema nucula]
MQTSSSILRCFARSSAPRCLRPSPPKRIPATNRPFHTPRTSMYPRPSPVLSRLRRTPPSVRYESSTSTPAPQPGVSTAAPETRLDKDQVPAYEMTFTCKKCDTRSSHRISKQGYHHGTVLITCPGCKNRHLMSDHLKIFSDKPVTLEDIMREKGDLVKRGSLGIEGDVEFWEDGTSTPRSAHFHPDSTTQVDPEAKGDRLTEEPTLPQDPSANAEDANPRT